MKWRNCGEDASSRGAQRAENLLRSSDRTGTGQLVLVQGHHILDTPSIRGWQPGDLPVGRPCALRPALTGSLPLRPPQVSSCLRVFRFEPTPIRLTCQAPLGNTTDGCGPVFMRVRDVQVSSSRRNHWVLYLSGQYLHSFLFPSFFLISLFLRCLDISS